MNEGIKDKLQNMYREQQTIKNDWGHLENIELKELKNINYENLKLSGQV